MSNSRRKREKLSLGSCIFIILFPLKHNSRSVRNSEILCWFLVGRKNVHRVSVKSKEVQTVGHQQHEDKNLENSGSHETKRNSDQNEDTIIYDDEELAVDVDGDNLGLDFLNGVKDKEVEEKENQIFSNLNYRHKLAEICQKLKNV